MALFFITIPTNAEMLFFFHFLRAVRFTMFLSPRQLWPQLTLQTKTHTPPKYSGQALTFSHALLPSVCPNLLFGNCFLLLSRKQGPAFPLLVGLQVECTIMDHVTIPKYEACGRINKRKLSDTWHVTTIIHTTRDIGFWRLSFPVLAFYFYSANKVQHSHCSSICQWNVPSRTMYQYRSPT